jgi:hypothetical protein
LKQSLEAISKSRKQELDWNEEQDHKSKLEGHVWEETCMNVRHKLGSIPMFEIQSQTTGNVTRNIIWKILLNGKCLDLSDIFTGSQ